MRILGSIPLSVAKELCSLERVTSNTDAGCYIINACKNASSYCDSSLIVSSFCSSSPEK